MARSPTQRSLDYLRKAGWHADVVERWIPGANIRRDLFGFVDIIALRGSETLAVQTTSASNVSARVRKITDHTALQAVREAGWTVHVHGWRKGANGRWAVRVVDIS